MVKGCTLLTVDWAWVVLVIGNRGHGTKDVEGFGILELLGLFKAVKCEDK